jgi:hypothetical protein
MRRIVTVFDYASPVDVEMPDQTTEQVEKREALLSVIRSVIREEDMREWWAEYAFSSTHRSFLQALYRVCRFESGGISPVSEEVQKWTWAVMWAPALDWLWAK